MIAEVVAFEGPVHRDVVAKRVARRWDLTRVGARMVAALDRAERSLVRSGTIVLREKAFLDMPESAPLERVRVPVPGVEESLRLIDHIAAVEIAVGVKCLLNEAGSFEGAQLVTQLTRAMGYDRTGSAIKARISRVIDNLVRTNHIAREGDRIFWIGL